MAKQTQAEAATKALRKAREQRIVAITTEIKKISRQIDLVQKPDEQDPRSSTLFDLYEALSIIESVVHNRLNNSATDWLEYKNDNKKGYEQLWTSIQAETKDAVKSLFRVDSDARQRSARFTNHVNALLVPRIFRILQETDPANAIKTVTYLVTTARNAINTNPIEYADVDHTDIQQELRQFNKDIKPVGALTNKQRMAMIKEIHAKLQLEAVAQQ